MEYSTREEWLEAACNYFSPRFEAAGRPLPKKVRVSIGFPPKGGMAKKKVLGVCFKSEAAEDKIVQVYINPTIKDTCSEQGILSTLLHELIHAVGISGHGKDFGAIAHKIGFEGKMSSSQASEGLMEDFKEIVEQLGDIPHSPLIPMTKETKKDGTRMLKCICPDVECGYNFRIVKKWAEMGLPECPACGKQLQLESDEC